MVPDTGHLAWAGVDVVQFCRDYADSIKTMHIKDVNPDVMKEEGVPAEWDYRTFSDKASGPNSARVVSISRPFLKFWGMPVFRAG